MEGALDSHPSVAEAACVPIAHPIKGQGIYAFVSLMQAGTFSPSHASTAMHPGALCCTVLLVGIYHVIMERIGQVPGCLCKSLRLVLSQRSLVISQAFPQKKSLARQRCGSRLC